MLATNLRETKDRRASRPAREEAAERPREPIRRFGSPRWRWSFYEPERDAGGRRSKPS